MGLCSMKCLEESRSEWILVDHLNKEQSGLLSVGRDNYHGASVRKNISPLARELLVDRIKTVADTAITIDEIVEHRGAAHRVRVEPIVSPASNTLVAVQAIHVPAGEQIPRPPVVGALEWIIWDDGRVETTWDKDMYELYEIPSSESSSPTGDMNQWVNQLIAPEDRARMKLTIDSGIKDSNGKRYFVHYRIITRMGTDNPGFKNLEVSSSVNHDPLLPMRRLCAITREVPELIPAINPEFGDTGGLMRAIFELSTDVVLAAVDVRRWQTFMTSASWEAFGIQSPKYGYLPHVVHPDDFLAFREAVLSDGIEPAAVRLLHTCGEYKPYLVSASAGMNIASTADADYVICSMKELITAGV